MKVYAIKRADGKYLKITINPYGDFNVSTIYSKRHYTQSMI